MNRWLYSFVPHGFNRLGLRNRKSVQAYKPPPSTLLPSPRPIFLPTSLSAGQISSWGFKVEGGGWGAKDCCLIAKPRFLIVAGTSLRGREGP